MFVCVIAKALSESCLFSLAPATPGKKQCGCCLGCFPFSGMFLGGWVGAGGPFGTWGIASDAVPWTGRGGCRPPRQSPPSAGSDERGAEPRAQPKQGPAVPGDSEKKNLLLLQPQGPTSARAPPSSLAVQRRFCRCCPPKHPHLLCLCPPALRQPSPDLPMGKLFPVHQASPGPRPCSACLPPRDRGSTRRARVIDWKMIRVECTYCATVETSIT